MESQPPPVNWNSTPDLALGACSYTEHLQPHNRIDSMQALAMLVLLLETVNTCLVIVAETEDGPVVKARLMPHLRCQCDSKWSQYTVMHNKVNFL